MSKHKNKIGKIFAGVLVVLAMALSSMAVNVNAAPVHDGGDGVFVGDAGTYFEWGCDGGTNKIACVLIKIINWMSIGVTIVVVGGIIYGSIMYTTAGGKADQAKKGMTIIKGGIIALVLYFAMYAILNFLIPGGMFE
ncbi:hypothetical protein FWF74_01695 [Candidatus Saccharibacteria bacterium]|nr:hypothetical protein [Candidatus Saccharibacteria bacterium]MCL1963389.1 hypothetical protein [Candidatus Saccharibacteria bacterium]